MGKYSIEKVHCEYLGVYWNVCYNKVSICSFHSYFDAERCIERSSHLLKKAYERKINKEK